MSFLQPLFLFALPVIALPVIIHLINQRRYQTVQWAAMMFLLAANRMSRGYAKLRQWLILLFRTLIVLGLILALCRPLASGSLGLLAGGQADTTIILFDRSPSMQQRGAAVASSKLVAARAKLSDTLSKLRSTRWVLVDSGSREAQEIQSPAALLELPAVDPSDTSADLPAMLEAARDYIQVNRTGRTEVWICSDVRGNDWQVESAQWQALRDAFASFTQGVRFHLLAYSEPAADNVSIRTTSVSRHESDDGAEVRISLRLERNSDAEAPLDIPIAFEIEGARSELTVTMTAATFELREHAIPLGSRHERGWGRVAIPSDTNSADNEFYFVFDRPAPRRTLIVGAEPQATGALQLVASISPDASTESVAEVVLPRDWVTADWDATALVIWQAPLPGGEDADLLREFVDRGGQVIFLPPAEVGSEEFMGVRWTSWVGAQTASLETWRGDQDVLAHARSGLALPAGDLVVQRSCGIAGEVTLLASLIGGQPLLARLASDRGGVYFCCTTPDPRDSSLAADGVVLYVIVHRALAAGAAALSRTVQLDAGSPIAEPVANWTRLAGPPGGLSTDYRHQRGAYRVGDRLLAINRSRAEDHAPILADDEVAKLFEGLNYSRVDDRVGSFAGLVQEIWRMFLFAMMAAIVVEAYLCLPRKPVTGAA